MPDITIYFCKRTRAFVPRWLLEELGVPYRVKPIRLDRREHKAAWFRRINPMGKVPALTDGEAVVSETPAICLLLADRYGMGTLAPTIDDPARGAYLRWMVFATAVFEPAVYLDEPQVAEVRACFSTTGSPTARWTPTSPIVSASISKAPAGSSTRGRERCRCGSRRMS
jgi:glutathione S-transferase